MKFGRQRDWIKQIQLARKEFLSGIQPTTRPQTRINNSLQAWLITSTEEIEEQSNNKGSLWATSYEILSDSSTCFNISFLWLNHVW